MNKTESQGYEQFVPTLIISLKNSKRLKELGFDEEASLYYFVHTAEQKIIPYIKTKEVLDYYNKNHDKLVLQLVSPEAMWDFENYAKSIKDKNDEEHNTFFKAKQISIYPAYSKEEIIKFICLKDEDCFLKNRPTEENPFSYEYKGKIYSGDTGQDAFAEILIDLIKPI